MRNFARLIPTLVAFPILVAATLPAQELAGSAPLEIIHGKPFVKVTINGQGPFRFVLDTGSGGEAIVSPQLADQLNLPSAGQIQLGDPSGVGTRKVPLVQVQSLQVAGIEFTGVKAARHVLSEADGTCQGLLGFPLFRNYLLTLDYPRQRMTLAPGAVAPDGERSVMSFRSPDGIPIVPLRIGGLQIEALIDSGGGGLSLPESLAARLKFSTVPAIFENAHSLATRFQVKAGQLAADIHLGSYTFAKPFVEINPAFPLANFGSCPMQNFAFTFDQRNHLVRMESGKTTLHLAATPTGARLQNSPSEKDAESALVPVG